MKSKGIKISILLLLALVLCASEFMRFASYFRNTIGYGVARQESEYRNVPDDASNIDYFIPGAFGPSLFVEFDCSEDSFLQWAKGFSDVRPVSERPYRVDAYEDYSTWKREEVIINDGHVFEWTFEDQGQYICYDRQTGRGYYHSHSR